VPPNGLELSCPAARASPHPFSRILAGQSPPNFPHASRVSCSELFGGPCAGAARGEWSHRATSILTRMRPESSSSRVSLMPKRTRPASPTVPE
jgi:hypothetical protein